MDNCDVVNSNMVVEAMPIIDNYAELLDEDSQDGFEVEEETTTTMQEAMVSEVEPMVNNAKKRSLSSCEEEPREPRRVLSETAVMTGTKPEPLSEVKGAVLEGKENQNTVLKAVADMFDKKSFKPSDKHQLSSNSTKSIKPSTKQSATTSSTSSKSSNNKITSFFTKSVK